ncbi:MAG TPA: outer membrane protein transport protein, partial [Nitrospiraceae bacterium]|nr:outer membrane protein transport protein [Nitrospiraceae bacterium]
MEPVHQFLRTRAARLFSAAVIIGILILTFSSNSRAGSYRIFDQSASAAGQASAFVAQADDASAGYYNPACMTQLHGMQFSLGATFIGGGIDFRNAAGQTAHGDLMGAVA